MTNPSTLPEASRRTFLRRTGAGIGTLALGSLLNTSTVSGADLPAESPQWQGVARPLAWPAQCKRVIHLCMAGGMSHLETLDYKPKLAEMNGQPMPESFT